MKQPITISLPSRMQTGGGRRTKKLLLIATLTALVILTRFGAFAQTPPYINYQAVVRNSAGELIADAVVTIRISILNGSSSGEVLYSETHGTGTTPQGLVNIRIGSGTIEEGDFSTIDWSDDKKFLKVALKQGSGAFTVLGTQQLISVPYAFQAQNAEAIAGRKVALTAPATGKVLKWNGTAWAPATDANTTTPTGTAGGDLTGSYPSPTIGANKVTTAKINNTAVTAAKLANGAVTAAKLNAMGATNGKVLKFNGTAWAPATDATGANYWSLSGGGDTLKRINGDRLALGWNSIASGSNATTLGYATEASGNTSLATGYATEASGFRSTAMGHGTTASGEYATATGNQTTASGDFSTAMGYNNEASGEHATALGNETTASGEKSTAMGFNNTASGYISTALGLEVTASGTVSIAMGNQLTASGNHTIAMGRGASTNNKNGSVIITDGENPNPHTTSTVNNQLTMRFNGGYRLLSTTGGTSGVSLAANGNSWSSISDSTKKENYQAAKGSQFLTKISAMKLGSWNYRGQDKTQYRHYGPMAQEFYAQFGSDGIGTIGNDTTIATADIDGVMMIAIQALIQENKALKIKHLLQDEKLEAYKTQNLEMNTRLEKLEQLLSTEERATMATASK